jgi:hypothetical protein
MYAFCRMMQISRITPQQFSYQSPRLPEKHEGASGTTWKTHVKVVLSYLILTIGITLAIASVYTATIVHPMIAMASPAIPIVLASLALMNKDGRPLLGFASSNNHQRGEPLGLKNNGLNCNLISLFQIFGNSKAFARRMHQIATDSSHFPPKQLKRYLAFLPFVTAYDTYRKEKEGLASETVSSVDMEKLRTWAEKFDSRLAREKGRQVDPVDFLGVFDSATGGEALKLQEHEKGADFSQEREANCSFLYLMQNDSGKADFREEFEKFFTNHNATNGRVTKKWFTEAPEAFFISLTQYDGNSEEEGLSGFRNVLQSLYLNKQKCPSAPSGYSLDGFVVHLGASSSSGHYVSFVRIENTWWKLDDQRARPVSHTEARAQMGKACLLHYGKEEKSGILSFWQ